jgi:hypothetical protein
MPALPRGMAAPRDSLEVLRATGRSATDTVAANTRTSPTKSPTISPIPNCPDASVNTSTPASTCVPPAHGCRYRSS